MQANRPVEDRIGVFGGSDAQAYMNVDWGCPLKLCLEYRGEGRELPREVSGDMLRGKYGEHVAVDVFHAKNPGIKLRRSHRTFYHPEFPFLMAHVDRTAPMKMIAEVKCPNRFGYTRIKREGLSEGWIYQGQHYCMVTGARAVLYIIHSFDPWEQITLEVESDKELQRIMLEKAIVLHAQAENGPLPDPLQPDDKRCARCVFRSRCHGSALVDGSPAGVETGDIEKDDSIGDHLRAYLDARKIAEEANELADAAKDQLIQALRDRPALQCGSHRIFYRTIQSYRWDTRTLESEHPELAEKYKRLSVSQPLRITEVSNDSN